jgi:predicted MFS family arabinose efflux permease
VPNLVAVPAGVALVLAGQSAWLAWLSATPVLALPLVPRLVAATAFPAPARRATGASRRALHAALAPSAVLFLVTMAGGGVVTFLPIERPDGAVATVALLLMGTTAAGGRWRAGVLADRLGNRVLLPASVLVTAVGLVVVAAGLSLGAFWVLAGAAVFGVGFGAAQNLTLVAAFARADDEGATTASALWNAAFDAGTGVGALALGAVAAWTGLSWTYALGAAALVLVLPLARLSARPGAPLS